jgi:DNA-binding GntR family transcriptional regulator
VKNAVQPYAMSKARPGQAQLLSLDPAACWGLCWHNDEKDAEMADARGSQKDAYALILEAIDRHVYQPGDRLVESELAERFGVSRTPIREALQRLETQSLLTRDGRSLIVASLDHSQLSELYVVRGELEGLAARLAARHAAPEEVKVLRDMLTADQKLVGDPKALSRANRRFHKQIHLASHNRFLVQQLDLVHRSMALLATTSIAAEGRGDETLQEHEAIVAAIEGGDGDAAYQALRDHISEAFVTRLKLDAQAVEAAE